MRERPSCVGGAGDGVDRDDHLSRHTRCGTASGRWTEAVLDPELEPWLGPIREFARVNDNAELRRARVRLEDKGAILAFHWRAATDESAAQDAVQQLVDRAQGEGLATHWGRKVLEVRPPVRIDKGDGITRLIREAGVRNAMYAGDDLTDLDAFRALTELSESGELDYVLRVGVASAEGPAELTSAADLVVDGTEGMRTLLASLVAEQ